MYKCSECGYTSPGFLGKCPECGAWGSMEETKEEKKTKSVSKTEIFKSKGSKPLKDVEALEGERILTGVSEFDRVMGGGILKDSLTILTARPGAGKSTLLLQVSNILASKGKKVLYASGEESASQIRQRAKRIVENISDNLFVISTNNLVDVLDEVESLDCDFVIVDSIQTFIIPNIESRAGSPTQIMESIHMLMNMSKNESRPRAVFIVGQMTKEDSLAGVRSLEHAVDTVLLLSGETYEELRILSTTKNRYGSTGEMGFFKMDEKGLTSIDNPSEYFMTERENGRNVPGSALSVTREGTRPIILEVESLVSKSFMPYPSRVSEHLRKEQLFTLISILEERGEVPMMDKNVVVKTTGGIKLQDTASNLSVIVSIYSSLVGKPVKASSVFIADVGLTGELKVCPSIDVRISEARRMGFKHIYVPKNIKQESKDLVKLNHIMEVLKHSIEE